MKKYRQKFDVDWLHTPKGTIWIPTPEFELVKYRNEKNKNIPFISPEDESLRKTPLGCRLDKHKDLFEEI